MVWYLVDFDACQKLSDFLGKGRVEIIFYLSCIEYVQSCGALSKIVRYFRLLISETNCLNMQIYSSCILS